jgi:hypothetical protein
MRGGGQRDRGETTAGCAAFARRRRAKGGCHAVAPAPKMRGGGQRDRGETTAGCAAFARRRRAKGGCPAVAPAPKMRGGGQRDGVRGEFAEHFFPERVGNRLHRAQKLFFFRHRYS